MLSFGLSEIAILFIVIVIVIGPKEIPNLLRQLGSLSKSLKKASRQFKNSLSELTDETSFNEVKNSISDISDLKKSIDPTNELKGELKSIKEVIKFTDKEISEINNNIIKDNKDD